jgi:hypothetical protein
MTHTHEQHSRLVPIERGRVGWTGLLEYVDPIVRAEAATHDERPSAAVVAALERRLGIRIEGGDAAIFRSLDDLTDAVAHALAAREVRGAACPGTIRVRVGDDTAFIEYDDLPTPYFIEHCRELLGLERPDRRVEIVVPTDAGLRAWVVLGRALKRRRRMNSAPDRQTDVAANDRPKV